MAYRYQTNIDSLKLDQEFSFVEKLRIALSLMKTSPPNEMFKNDILASERGSENGRGNVQHRTGGIISKEQHEAIVHKATELRRKRLDK